MNQVVYFVTEGKTDQIILEELIGHWIGEFIPRHIQPPASEFVQDQDTPLSNGWRGVLAWCKSQITRDEVVRNATCLVIHLDADIASDTNFKNPICPEPCPPASGACNWVRNEIINLFEGGLPNNVVLCIPAQDLEAWVVSALLPEVADRHIPIECRVQPGTLLIPRKLTRWKNNRLVKDTVRYLQEAKQIVRGWSNCVDGTPPRCPEALRFELDVRQCFNRDTQFVTDTETI
jgi:hypothetical protein